MLGFEIGQRESGFNSERTDRQNHRIAESSSTVLLYRLRYIPVLTIKLIDLSYTIIIIVVYIFG